MKNGTVCNPWRKSKGLPESNIEKVYATAAWIIGKLTDGEPKERVLQLIWLQYVMEMLAELCCDTQLLDFETRYSLNVGMRALEKALDKKKSPQYGYADSLM